MGLCRRRLEYRWCSRTYFKLRLITQIYSANIIWCNIYLSTGNDLKLCGFSEQRCYCTDLNTLFRSLIVHLGTTQKLDFEVFVLRNSTQDFRRFWSHHPPETRTGWSSLVVKNVPVCLNLPSKSKACGGDNHTLGYICKDLCPRHGVDSMTHFLLSFSGHLPWGSAQPKVASSG